MGLDVKSISKHVTYKEATHNQTATQLGIDNTPDAVTIGRMKKLAEAVFQPLREHFGVSLYVSSFYRSDALNKAVGGSKTSQHVLGEAMDIDADIYGKVTNKQLFDYIKDNLEFDQLVWEYGDNTNPAWIHVSFTERRPNRRSIIIVYKLNDGTTRSRTYDL